MERLALAPWAFDQTFIQKTFFSTNILKLLKLKRNLSDYINKSDKCSFS